MPWWSFADGFGAIRDAAGMSGGMAAIRQALEEHDEMSNMPGMKTNVKTGGELASGPSERVPLWTTVAVAAVLLLQLRRH